MGDKWTTSGGWRLKSKQNRTFAARTSQKNHGKTSTGSTLMIAASKNTNSSAPQTQPILRKRNGGGKSI